MFTKLSVAAMHPIGVCSDLFAALLGTPRLIESTIQITPFRLASQTIDDMITVMKWLVVLVPAAAARGPG